MCPLLHIRSFLYGLGKRATHCGVEAAPQRQAAVKTEWTVGKQGLRKLRRSLKGRGSARGEPKMDIALILQLVQLGAQFLQTTHALSPSPTTTSLSQIPSAIVGAQI